VPQGSQRQRFPASARLRNSGEFAEVRAGGRMVQGRLLRMTALMRADQEVPVRLGVVTSRRVGPAVARSLVRRRLREIFRACRQQISPGLWLVVTAKTGAAEAGFAPMRDEWLRLAGRLSIFRNLP
jgi:ribonuclease P protein component